VKHLHVVGLALVLTCSAATFGQTENRVKKPGPAEQQVLALNNAWADAITKGDAATLDRILADDVIVTSGNGEIRNKAAEIKDSAGPPDPDFVWTRPFTTEDVRVRIYRDSALVTGRAKWGFRYRGPEVNQERRYTHMYVKQQGKWRIVAQQVSSNLYKKP
jgi:ketosteroid isomerase-like protein